MQYDTDALIGIHANPAVAMLPCLSNVYNVLSMGCPVGISKTLMRHVDHESFVAGSKIPVQAHKCDRLRKLQTLAHEQSRQAALTHQSSALSTYGWQ